MTRTRLILVLLSFVLYALFLDRLVVKLSTGGAGIIAIMSIVVPFSVAVLLVLPEMDRALGFLFEIHFWKSAGPFLILGFFLFPVGVIVYGHPVRILWGMIIDPLVMFAFIAMGYWIASRGKDGLKLTHRVVQAMIAFESVYAIGVFLQKNGTFSFAFLEYLVQWDRVSQVEHKTAYLLDGRAIGTYINPNTLGIALGLFWCWVITSMRGARRVLFCGIIAIALYFCESRGSWFGVIAATLVVAFKMLRRQHRSSQRPPIVSSIVKLLATAVAVVSLIVLLLSQRGFLSDRMQSGFDVFSEGATADNNFAGRVDVWKKAPGVLAAYPFGVLAPPEMVVGSYIDSEYVEFALQGGLILLVSYLLLLSWGIGFGRPGDREPCFISMSSIFVAVNSVSALPVPSAGFSLYWIELGVLYYSIRRKAT